MASRWRYIFRLILSRRENRAFLPVVIIILILLLYSLYSVYLTTPSQPQLSIYSNNWGDLSNCRQDIIDNGYNVSSIISSPTILSKFKKDEHYNKLYMSIGVQRPYSREEANNLWQFVSDGGKIIIADDFGFGNTFWDTSHNDDINKIEFQKKQLFDPNYIKNTTFVIVGANLPGYSDYYYQLILNAPTGLEEKSYSGSGNIDTLAASSEGSWLDENENRVRDASERKKSYKIIIHFYIGKKGGEVVMVSDPGLFINDNWQKMDNSEYVLDLISIMLPYGGEVIFDESRHISEDSFENTRRSFYSGTVMITSTIWSILALVFIIISFTLIIGIKLKPQKVWGNKNLLNTKYLNVLNYPYITSYDFWQIYNTFLEKVRLNYGFSPDEFRELEEDVLYKLIDDRYLWDFITQQFPSHADFHYYKLIIDRILRWSPKEPGTNYETIDKSFEQDHYGKTELNNHDYQSYQDNFDKYDKYDKNDSYDEYHQDNLNTHRDFDKEENANDDEYYRNEKYHVSEEKTDDHYQYPYTHPHPNPDPRTDPDTYQHTQNKPKVNNKKFKFLKKRGA